LRPAIAHAGQHAQPVRFKRQPGAHAAEHQDLLRSWIADGRKLLQCALGLLVRLIENPIEIAAELADGDARNLAPAEHASLGTHAAPLGQRQQRLAIRLENRQGLQPNLRSQAFKHLGAALVRQ
jgi:hypothetical protein